MTTPRHDSTATEQVGAAAFALWRPRLAVPALARPRGGIRVLVLGCLALAALTLLLPSTPTYDPWAWIVWGREVISGHLSTTTGPSWKPLPVVFTAVFALAGSASPALWLIVARAGGFLALVFSYRLSRRLGGPLAGIIAVAALMLVNFFARAAFLGDSEGLLIAFTLCAAELHLVGRRRDAVLAGFGAALLRPEAWLFVGLYGLWLFWREPSLRLLLVGLGIAVPALWLGPELWGSGNAFRASARAQQVVPGSPGAAADPTQALLDRAWPLVLMPVRIGAALAIFGAVWMRRRIESRAVLLIAGAAALWFAEVIVMANNGYSGNVRYLLAPSALVCVLGGVGLARLVSLVPAGRRGALRVAAGIAVVAVLVPYSFEPARLLELDAHAIKTEARINGAISDAVRLAGGSAAVLACGKPTIGNLQVTPLVWELHAHLKDVGYIAPPRAVAFFAEPARRGAGLPRAQLKGGGYEARGVAGVWHVLKRCGARS